MEGYNGTLCLEFSVNLKLFQIKYYLYTHFKSNFYPLLLLLNDLIFPFHVPPQI